MPKVKTTRVPLPGQNPKKAPKIDETARKKTKPVTGEVIVESDDASDSDSTSGRSAGSTSDVEKQKNTKKPDVKKVKKTEIASPSVPSDESSEEESESEEGTESASESGSEESSSESESQSESESSEDATAKKATSQAPATARVHTTQLRAAQSFEPPSGFKATSFQPDPSSNLSKILSSDLADKQIWHITAPAAISIKQIKEFTLGKAMGKEAVVQHGGVDYGFAPQEKDARVATKLLIPTPQGYRAVPNDFSEAFHLQEIVRLPNFSKKQDDPARDLDPIASFTTPAPKPARQQPKGLRMRYRPAGAVDDEPGTIGVSDSEGDAALQIRTKRRNAEADGAEASSKKAKKDKKHKSKEGKAKHTEQEAESEVAADAMEIDGETPKKASKDSAGDSEKTKKREKQKKEKKEKKK